MKMFRKKILAFLSLTAIISIAVLPSVYAQATTNIKVNLTVDESQMADLTLDGCWITSETPGEWIWSGSAISLLQPGDRESGSGTDGDAYNWYDVYGGVPNGYANSTNTNTFAYGDCRFKILIQNYSAYDIQLYGTDFTDGGANEIPDMVGSDTTGFNFNFASEDPGNGTGDEYPYAAGQGEHGFFIVGLEEGSGPDPLHTADILQDTGDGTITYTAAKKFDATTCGDGTPTSTRPCYHAVPDILNSKTLIDENAGNLTDAKIIIRTGLGASGLIPADYTFSQTMALVTPP